MSKKTDRIYDTPITSLLKIRRNGRVLETNEISLTDLLQASNDPREILAGRLEWIEGFIRAARELDFNDEANVCADNIEQLLRLLRPLFADFPMPKEAYWAVVLAMLVQKYFENGHLSEQIGSHVTERREFFQRLEALNRDPVTVRPTITRDGRERAGYVKSPVTPAERDKVLKLDKELSKKYTTKAERYRAIAKKLDMTERRARNIVEKYGKK